MIAIFLIVVAILVMKGLGMDMIWLSELLRQLAEWLA
jgi:hypothetical protein